MSEYSIDSILRDDIKICQLKEGGFRFGTDSLMLAHFSKAKRKDNILEVGAGSGIISILIAKLYGASVTAVELQEPIFHTLLESIKLSNVEDKVNAIWSDIRSFRPATLLDHIISNPPYRKLGIGKVAVNEVEAIARFDISLSLEDILIFAKSYLKDRGRLTISYDADLMIDAIALMRAYKIEPKRLQFIHPKVDSRSKVVLIEAIKGAGVELIVEKPIIQDGSEEAKSTYNSIFSCNWQN